MATREEREGEETCVGHVDHGLRGVASDRLDDEVIVLGSTDHEIRHRVPGEHAGSEHEEILRVRPPERSYDGNVPVGDAATIELVEQLATVGKEMKDYSRLSWWLEYRSSGNEANMFLRWVKAATLGLRFPDWISSLIFRSVSAMVFSTRISPLM